MRRRDMLRAGLAAGSAVVAGCARRADGPAFEEGFENGIGDWRPDAAIGPEVAIEEFEWEVTVSGEQAAGGERSLRIWNEGDYDDGVTWVSHPVSLPSGGAAKATGRAQIWSESESFNTLRDAVMRLGSERPATEEEFPHPGVNTTALGETPYGGLREPLWLADGWREYTLNGRCHRSRRIPCTSRSAPASSGRGMRPTTLTISQSSSRRGDDRSRRDRPEVPKSAYSHRNTMRKPTATAVGGIRQDATRKKASGR